MKADLMFFARTQITRSRKIYSQAFEKIPLIEEQALIFILVHTRVAKKSHHTEQLVIYKVVATKHCFKSKN